MNKKRVKEKQGKRNCIISKFFDSRFVLYLQNWMLYKGIITEEQWEYMRERYIEWYFKRHPVEDAMINDPERAEQMLERIHQELDRRSKANAAEETNNDENTS